MKGSNGEWGASSETDLQKLHAMTIRLQWLKVAENCEQMTVNSSLCLSGLSLRARSQVYNHYFP
jgi:hypothetical protein